MAKIVEQTPEKTTYQLQSSQDKITLANLPFETVVNESIIFSLDNEKIPNQLSLL